MSYYAQVARGGAFNNKIDIFRNVWQNKDFKGYWNCMIGSKVTAIFGSLQISLPCIDGKLAGGESVAVAVSDIWQVTGNTQYIKHDTWHLTSDTRNLTPDIWHVTHDICFICFNYLFFSVLLPANVERFSVPQMRDFFKNNKEQWNGKYYYNWLYSVVQ